MRVIAGKARGKRLVPLKGEDVRPTSDMVKEALFNILQFGLEGRCFLDLFAGTGQIGIEALSRGVARAVFVDASRKSIEAVRANIAAAGFQAEAELVHADSIAYLQRALVSFDIAFLDPPYRKGLIQEALPLVAERMHLGGVILCEHPLDEDLPEEAGAFRKEREYRYGRILLTSYRRVMPE